jgi:hypothetical protein
MEKKNEIAVKGNYAVNSPSQMTAMAKVLKSHIVRHKLYTEIAGKNYAHVEGWQFAGGLMGLFPRVMQVENLSTTNEIKWKADVEVFNLSTGEIVSRGFAICSNKESKKKSFDEYAILSMGQTRAIGKAYRNLIGWVMKLAGYEATPSEEMFKMGETVPTPPPDPQVVTKSTAPKKSAVRCQVCAESVDERVANYSQRVFGKILCRKHQTGKKK